MSFRKRCRVTAPEVQDQRGDFGGLRSSVSTLDIGNFLIERRTGLQNLGDLGDRPGGRQRRPRGAGPQVGLEPPGQFGRLGPQPDDEPEVAQQPAVAGSQHGPAAGGQNRPGMVLDQLPQRPFFPVPKRRLSRVGEDRHDRPPGACLDLTIGIQEPPVQPICQDLADGGFAGAPVTRPGPGPVLADRGFSAWRSSVIRRAAAPACVSGCLS